MHCPLCGSPLVWEQPLEPTQLVAATVLSCAECGSRSVALVDLSEPLT